MSGQYLNCESKKAFVEIFLFDKLMYWLTLTEETKWLECRRETCTFVYVGTHSIPKKLQISLQCMQYLNFLKKDASIKCEGD